MKKEPYYCGLVAIIGRTNVGKSTLLNRLIGQKISITSRKPQTTRHRIIGINTKGVYQAIYIDTPGVYIEDKKIINQFINGAISSLISDIKIIIFVIEGTKWIASDQIILNKLKNIKIPVLIAINKIDNINNKNVLLYHLKFLSQQIKFIDIVPISAKNGYNIDKISNIVHNLLPEGEHIFSKEYITNNSKKFMASEIIREKLMRFLGDELPYKVHVEIKQFTINNLNSLNINGLIVVKRDSQKKIIIGSKGSKIKLIGIEARQDMENLFMRKVNLNLWVKVKIKSGCLEYTRALYS